MSKTVFHRVAPPWYEDVQHLKPGGRRRLGDGTLVSFNGKGYHLFDFREKTSEVYEPQLSLAERLAIIQQQREQDSQAAQSLALPTEGAMSHPQDWPLDARVWFYRAGIGNDEIARLGAFWSLPMGRLVLPYRTVDGSEAWIARDPYWSKGGFKPGTKYLFPYGAKRGGGAAFRAYGAEHAPSGIVISEDALSAYRIARDTDLYAIAAQGTSLDRDAVVHLAEIAQRLSIPVFTWLDPDVYGQRGATKLWQQFGNLGVFARNIVSARDPKLHEPHEIREALET